MPDAVLPEITRTPLHDGSTCVVERHDDEKLALVAREVNGVVVWGYIYVIDGKTDAVAETVARMTETPALFRKGLGTLGFGLAEAIEALDVLAAVESDPDASGDIGIQLLELDGEGEFQPVADYSPRLVVDRDDEGMAVSAVGVSPSGKPFAVEWDWHAEGPTTNLFQQLQDLGFDGITIEAAYTAARTTYLSIGDAFEGTESTFEGERPKDVTPQAMRGPHPQFVILDEVAGPTEDPPDPT